MLMACGHWPLLALPAAAAALCCERFTREPAGAQGSLCILRLCCNLLVPTFKADTTLGPTAPYQPGTIVLCKHEPITTIQAEREANHDCQEAYELIIISGKRANRQAQKFIKLELQIMALN